MSSPPVREDIIQSAVRFLSDPKVQESPLAKRIAFLEKKGLSPAEVEVALARANGTPVAPTSAVQPGQYVGAGGPYQPYPAYPPPPPPSYGWKDYTLGAIGVAGVGYGTYTLFKNHILPLLSFPSQAALDDSTTTITQQLALTSKSLDAAHAETTELVKSVDQQAASVAFALKEITDTLATLKESDELRDQEMRDLKADVDGVREMIPQVLDRSRESQTTVIADLQAEIKSLKNLLLNRSLPTPSVPASPSGSSSSLVDDGLPPPPAPLSQRGSFAAGNIPSKPTIPAWQLQQKTPAAATATAGRAKSPTKGGGLEKGSDEASLGSA
ncbi:peroxisomal membrane protein pex14 [Thoreauomyces humboldtii]|nr:peroxisomal membrane protein pex14 [Thoreauomyces humboldtii]